MEDLRAQFQALLDEKRQGVDVGVLQRAMEQEILDTFRGMFPRSRIKIPESRDEGRWETVRKKLKPKMVEEFDAIYEKHSATAKLIFDAHEKRRDEIKVELKALAKKIKPQSSGEFRKVYEVGPHAYSTQGFGASSYAHANAQRHARDLEFEGIEVEIRKVMGKKISYVGYPSTQSMSFEVWAKCSDLDYEISQNRPGISLKDELQWCWNRQINPRVMNPFLPHGLEEKLGVTFQPKYDEKGDLSP